MTRAADLIEALNARKGVRVPRERSTGLPYGWALWIKARASAMLEQALHADQLLALLAARPPRELPRAEELNRWQALLALFRQGWLPPPAEERPLRGLSWAGSLLLHLLFVLLLAWISYLQSLLPPRPDAAGGGGGRVGIGFVAREDAGQGGGTPGGEAQPAPVQARAATSAGPAAAASGQPAPAQADPQPEIAPQVAAVEVPVQVRDRPPPPLPDVRMREVPVAVEPQHGPVVEVPVPPVPPAAREVPVRQAELQVREREVPLVQAPAIVAPVPREVDIPLPVAPQPELRPREVAMVEAPALQVPPVRTMEPRTAVRLPELRQREVGEPLPEVEVAAPAVTVPPFDPRPAVAAAVRQREVAMPGPGAASVAAPAAAAPAQAAPAPAGPDRTAPPGVAASTNAAPPGVHSPAATPGATTAGGSRPAGSAPGADPWAQALADDRWGPPGDAGSRSPGLFDADGRARLPGAGDGAGQGPGPGPGSGAGQGLAERGAPGGGNDTWSRERIEQAGTWLKRPPYDYEPTTFDRYWVPNQSLLADWVRKGIQSVAIPIPGSNGKKLNCVVSLLQLGGGCGISDDNLNEQPAVARPPPDIPFKPELQEDNGSVVP